MREHDLTSGRAPRGAFRWLILIAIAIGCACGLVAPVSAPGQSAPEASRLADDPINLAARRIRVWQADGAQWVALTGQAAVIQGLEGLRGDEALARIVSIDLDGTPAHRIDVYAEGAVLPNAPTRTPQRSVRASFISKAAVRVEPYEGTPTLLAGPPTDLPLLTRAFPPRPPARPTPVAAVAPVAGRQAPKLPSPPLAKRGVGKDREVPTPAKVAVGRAEHRSIPLEPDVVRAQNDAPDDFMGQPPAGNELPPVELPAIEDAPTVPNLSPASPPGEGPTELVPLPGPDDKPAAPRRRNGPAAANAGPPVTPVLPGTQRVTRVYPRGGPNFEFQILPTTPDGISIIVIRGGVNVVAVSPPPRGIIDLSADSAIIWRHVDPKKKGGTIIGPNGETIDDLHSPMEVYLEGNVVIRQDGQTLAGPGDQKTYRANQAYYDFRSDRLIALKADLDVFAPGLLAPMKLLSPRIDQFRALQYAADGKLEFGLQQIRAVTTTMTGSRFPNPGYKITNTSVDLTQKIDDDSNPFTGKSVGDPRDPNAPPELTWRYNARNNFFYSGPIPTFYWPQISGEVDDLEPPLRMIAFRDNNVFGQQLALDFNGYKVFGMEKPPEVDLWNLDVDYLSRRTQYLPALGSEIGWFGRDLLNDLADPFHKQKGVAPSVTTDYFGYMDFWFLKDNATDILGPGPAVVTQPADEGKAGFQRTNVPAFQQWRGRFNMRHMQYLLPPDDAHKFEDARVQVEAAYISDRNFLEEYYQRLSTIGLDQETLIYAIRQKNNWAYSGWAESNNGQNWYTETQWLPRLDFYMLGESLASNTFTYSQHSGIDYASVHTAVEVDNKNTFAFMPYDPISNTHGVWNSGRAFSTHELDLPLNFDFIRFVPYVQGQLAGWSNQLSGVPVGRVWGAAGARVDVSAWKAYPKVNSELFNVHGLNHKIDFEADYRDAYSNVKLNSLGVQDDLDDNTNEWVRRYFALTNYAGGLLPNQYDPRQLIVRRAVSPITGPADIQASVETLHFGLHQRLQTKRGPEGRRRIIDYMTLDLTSTYFPDAARDNFGKPFGQNMYNWQWFLGDRTSIVSYGWFEFFNIGGVPLNNANITTHNNPFGLNVITSGVSINRPPRTSIFIGYTVLDTGPITTSALNASVSYWLSPKYFGTYSTSYDFGNHVLLGSAFSVTRIGADWITTVGLTVDPQRQSYMAAVQISPRLSPNVRLGGGSSMNQFDTRFAPTE